MEIVITENGTDMTVALAGRLDTLTSSDLDKAVKPYLTEPVAMVLECSAMDYISSSGLRVVLSIHKALTASGGRLVVRNLNREVRSVFDITGLDRVLCLE